MEVKRICKQCGIEFPVRPYLIKQGYGKFCSPKCHGKWRSEHQSGKNNPNWKGGKIKCICQQCGTEFPVKPFVVKRGGGKFCSPKCHHESQKTQIKRICQQCGIIFPVKPTRIKQNGGLFCSNKCRYKYQTGENSPTWQGGLSFEPYCTKFNFAFKEYIRDKFGRICFLCDKIEEENGRRLSVHHVNYNKNCGCDEDETCQFVPLCIGCNSKVNNNREEWEAKIKTKMKNKLNGWYI